MINSKVVFIKSNINEPFNEDEPLKVYDERENEFNNNTKIQNTTLPNNSKFAMIEMKDNSMVMSNSNSGLQYNQIKLTEKIIDLNDNNTASQKIQEEEGAICFKSCKNCYGACCGWISSYICCCFCESPYKEVPESRSGIILRFGKFFKLVGPGLVYLNPETDSLMLIDKRERLIKLPSQHVVTKDNVSIKIDAVLYFSINDSHKSQFAVQNLEFSLAELAVSSLRNTVGVLTLQQLLQERDNIEDKMIPLILKPSRSWGCTVTRVLIQDLFLPQDIQISMSSATTAKKLGEAKLISSQANVKIAKFMREAAESLNSDAAMQIRLIQSLESLTQLSTSKIVFFPTSSLMTN